MRANEFIKEGKGGTADLKPHHAKAAPRGERIDTDTFYGMYRLGVAIAGDGNAFKHGPVNDQPTVWVRYPGEQEKLDKAKKILGVGSTVVVADATSHEMDSTNKVSPVAKVKKNKYGI